MKKYFSNLHSGILKNKIINGLSLITYTDELNNTVNVGTVGSASENLTSYELDFYPLSG